MVSINSRGYLYPSILKIEEILFLSPEVEKLMSSYELEMKKIHGLCSI